jgi:hypothetical protein
MSPDSVNFHNTTRLCVPEDDNFTVTDCRTSNLVNLFFCRYEWTPCTRERPVPNIQDKTNLQYAPIGISNQDTNMEDTEFVENTDTWFNIL